jgi:hypothetical protein
VSGFVALVWGIGRTLWAFLALRTERRGPVTVAATT